MDPTRSLVPRAGNWIPGASSSYPLTRWKYSVLFDRVAVGHMKLVSIGHVASATDELNFHVNAFKIHWISNLPCVASGSFIGEHWVRILWVFPFSTLSSQGTQPPGTWMEKTSHGGGGHFLTPVTIGFEFFEGRNCPSSLGVYPKCPAQDLAWGTYVERKQCWSDEAMFTMGEMTYLLLGKLYN